MEYKKKTYGSSRYDRTTVWRESLVAGTLLSARKAGFFQKDLCQQNWSKHRLNHSSGLGIAALDAGEMYRRIPGRNTPYRCLENKQTCRGFLFGNICLKNRPKKIVVTQRS
jgi:hypothetical protein